MKNLLSIILLTLLTGFAYAQQVNVTLSVDVTNETVDPSGVHVAGNWDPNATWNPAAFPMTQSGNMWNITIQVEANSTFEYKFLLGDDWSKGNEGLDSEAGCVVGNGNTNRVLTVGDADIVVAPVCYNSCGLCKAAGEQSVTFKVDLSQEAVIDDKVILTGGFAGWSDTYLMRDDNNDKIYTMTLNFLPGDYEFKYKNGPDGWESVSGSCVANGNRTLTVADEDLILPVVCLGRCEPCVLVNNLNVTFLVDMTLVSNLEGISPNGVHIAGNFQKKAGYANDWTPGITELTDSDGDKIYELRVVLPEGEYEYKYLNGNDWGTEESIPQGCVKPGTPNRGLTIAGNEGDEVTVGPICFSSCTADCPVLGAPINVTFRVDMTNEFVDSRGLFVSGDFFTPKWRKDTLKMEEDAQLAGIYTFTRSVRPGIQYAYKYFNGGDDTGQEDGDFITGGCGVDNGFGGSNRLLDLEGVTEDVILPVYIFNTCDLSTVSTGEISYLNEFKVFPNPANEQMTLQFSNDQNLKHSVELLDLTGRKVQTLPLQEGSVLQINRNNLQAGFYIGRLVNERGETHTFKVSFE